MRDRRVTRVQVQQAVRGIERQRQKLDPGQGGSHLRRQTSKSVGQRVSATCAGLGCQAGRNVGKQGDSHQPPCGVALRPPTCGLRSAASSTVSRLRLEQYSISRPGGSQVAPRYRHTVAGGGGRAGVAVVGAGKGVGRPAAASHAGQRRETHHPH